MSADTRSKSNEPSTKDNYVIIITLVFAIAVAILMFFTFFNTIDNVNKSRTAWKVLEKRSDPHRVLVNTYKGCKDRFLFAGSVEECLILVKEYGEMKGYKEELPVIIEDISKVAESIKN